MDLHDYVAEEIATDCADGLISRREALRRLGLIGLGAVSAAAVLAACSNDDDAAAKRTSTSRPSSTSTSPTTTLPGGRVEVESIAISGGRRCSRRRRSPRARCSSSMRSSASPTTSDRSPAASRATVLRDHRRSGSRRHRAGGDQGKVISLLTGSPEDQLLADMRLGLDELERRAPGAKLAVVGFCFGGGLTWRLLAAGEPRVAVAVPFYGPAPDAPDFSRSKAAVLAIYGELDDRVNGTRDTAVSALTRAGLTHEVRTFPGADHGFFNDTGAALQRSGRGRRVSRRARLVQPLPSALTGNVCRVSPAR